SLELQTIELTPDGLTQTASVFLETSMPTHDDMARFSYARDESTLTSPRLCISSGDSINCSGFGPEANGWLLRLPPVLQALHGFSMPPIALTPMLDKLADTSMGTIGSLCGGASSRRMQVGGLPAKPGASRRGRRSHRLHYSMPIPCGDYLLLSCQGSLDI